MESFAISSKLYFKILALFKASLLYPIITINHLKFIAINLIGILNHVKKNWFFLSSNVYFYSL